MIKKIRQYKIYLSKENTEIKCLEDDTVLEAVLRAHINHSHTCGGTGKCSTCRIRVIKGIENCNTRNKIEQLIADKLSFPSEVRLACQTKVSGDISIRRIVSDELDQEIIFEQFSENSKGALGNQQKLTMVFTDIVNYTSWAEKFPPYDTMHVLNRYYKIMNKVIVDNHGFISDVTGDGILAIFGLNKENGNSVLDATMAIREMHHMLRKFNNYLMANFNTKYEIRIGVHYGNVIVGSLNFGSMKKMAVIGDNVNFASRVETANKLFKTKLLFSEDAYQMIKEKFPKYKVYTTLLKGKSGEYKLYEIL
ncbi:adenylate/guanylate cyclase domain-containing protein [Maribacter ulvicola]|uniref:Adenylate cyclase n=1 Tax=Maribacter ulvicola TaxID=228959 RepID=A0A1N6V7S2_9FLAO|nr:adenylate/guanylate cyclase domain-containing protein [Maribacter ulvicola]SIQ73933.1 adenylate cyclase [Maribacter ulvicola]